jgi:hypothetical protein
MEIPFIGGAYQDKSFNMDAQVCQNLSVVVDQQGGKSVLSLEGISGGIGLINMGFYSGTFTHYSVFINCYYQG